MEPHFSDPASCPTTVRWDPRDYASHSAAQENWAQELIARLALHGNESVLDLGCGDGKVTAAIARQVPHGRVWGIDSSPEMIAFARETFPAAEVPNLDFACMDARSFRIDHQFGIIFSNAALHWVDDHRAVLSRCSAHLEKGGRLFISCGGAGNAAALVQIFHRTLQDPRWQPFFDGFRFPYYFYSPAEYERWLEQAGFRADRLALSPKDMVHTGAKELAAWIRTAWLPYTQRVPEEQQSEFIRGVVDRYLAERPLDSAGNAHVKMVRLEVQAVKVGASP